MWKWGSEQEEAFRDLKLKLASPPVFKPADGTKPFVIRTDAKREALAVDWALEKFRGYVEGQTIRLSSGHQTLKWLLSLKSPPPTSEQEKADSDILIVFIDFPTRSPKEVRQEQLKDDERKKIIEYFENKMKKMLILPTG
ncbi:transposon Ty3-I Gag-Pol polyprotein [Trichonephila clavipes]|nr:transposon Ty3-I Gag-Pol polyprotein [Trichonephila clavipes]